MKFKSDIEIQAGVEAGGSTGSNGQVLSSTGSGVAWINQGDIIAGESEVAKSLQVTVKNVSGGELTKGTVIHTAPTASPPSGNVIEVIAADYDDTAKMPALGILKETIANEAEGEAVMTGTLSGIATDGFSIGDELYVGADGALTNVKPQTAGQLIQKIAVCVKSHASNGLIKIFGAGRSNDVPLPLYIDNANQRLGVGADSPSDKLQVNQGSDSFRGITIEGTSPALYLKDTQATNAYHIGANGNYLYFLEDSNQSGTYNNIMAYWDPSNNFIFNTGNVGIGTTSPSAKLDVRKDTPYGLYAPGSPQLNLVNTNTEGTAGFLVLSAYYNNTNNTYYKAGGIGGGKETATGNQEWGGYLSFFTTSDGTAGAASGMFEHMRITADGYVGIGTTIPSEKLEVDGNVKIKDVLLSNQVNTNVDTGAEVVAQVSTSTYTAAFFDFVIKKVGNIRSGTVYACHDGINVEFTETSTNDLGDTSDVTLSVDKSGTNLRLIATVTSDDWIIKSLIRAI